MRCWAESCPNLSQNLDLHKSSLLATQKINSLQKKNVTQKKRYHSAFCIFLSFQCKHSAKDENHAEISSEELADGTGQRDVVTDTTSSPDSSNFSLPSNERYAGERAFLLFVMRNSARAGKMTGRKDSECGQMGVIPIDGTDGWIMVPPQDKL
jgi:hypothetical protein